MCDMYANSVLSSHRKSLFVCLRLFHIFLNENVFLSQYKCCIETRFSRCSSQEFSGFSVIVGNTLNSGYVDIHYLLMCHGKSLNFSL